MLIISANWAVRKLEIFSPLRWRSQTSRPFLSKSQKPSLYSSTTCCISQLLTSPKAFIVIASSLKVIFFLGNIFGSVLWNVPLWHELWLGTDLISLRQAKALRATCPSQQCDYMLSLTSTTVISADVNVLLYYNTFP